MKHWKIAINTLLCVGAFLFVMFPAYGATLKATPSHTKFGTIDEGPSVVVKVVIENTGKSQVEITNIQTNCACTEAVLEKRTLAAGEKTELQVTYQTQGRPGPFDKNVTFSTNIPGEEKIEIFSFNGDVREAPGAKIAVAPRRVMIEGDNLNTGKKQAFSVKNEGSLPLVITGMRSKDGKNVYYDGAKEGRITVEPGKERNVELQLKGKSDVGAGSELILIESNAINAGESGLFLMIQYK